MPQPHEDTSAHPKAATQQPRAVLLIHLGTPKTELEDAARTQASALESKLPEGMRVFAAACHGRPTIAEVLHRVEDLGLEAVVAVSMYPPYSRTTTLPVARELYRQIEHFRYRMDVTMRGVWYDDAGYINAQAHLLHEYAHAHDLTPDNAHLVYAVRSIPASDADGGDPYLDQVHRTAELVSRRLGWPADRTTLAYLDWPGSSGGLRPTMSEALADLSRSGEKIALLCALGFTTDCPQVQAAGVKPFPCPGLNAYEPFLAALRNLVLHGRHPVSFGQTAAGLMAAARSRRAEFDGAEAPIDSLIMVGMSLGGRLGPGQGPVVTPADADTFRQIKKRQCDVPEILRAVCQDQGIREAWLWNTCRRFELYGWLKTPVDEAERADIITLISRQLSSADGPGASPGVNVLCGADAWHYLLRTAVGLNSGLPGEREVLQQLQAAHRLAARAGTAGPLTDHLLDEVARHERRLRDQTEWGRFTPSYCYAAMSRIAPAIGLDRPGGCRCVVIGGSTTSCAILEALAGEFGVPGRRLTLLHRGHGHDGHLKMLRRAIGSGRRRRVHKYGEKSVIEAIGDADVVFIGLDRREPVLDADRIRECRDFTARPLAIVDFNMFGSTAGLGDMDGVRVWNAEELEAAATAFAETMCGSVEFARAAEAAEAWIRDRLPAP
ncbi:MAG: ferrochelatase [Planctomycetota bacterium]|jgi:protoheme ferro-lyase/glutamyl-tRNA reductase